MRRRLLLLSALALPLIAAACTPGGGTSDDLADHPACEPVERLVAAYEQERWDDLDAATREIRTAIAASGDERLAPLREAVIGTRNQALAETFWVPPDERALVRRLLAADPADLDPADRRLRAEVLRERVEGAPDRLPDPPRDDAGARAFLRAAQDACDLGER